MADYYPIGELEKNILLVSPAWSLGDERRGKEMKSAVKRLGGCTTPMNLGEGDTVYSDLRPVVSITERIYEIIFGVGSTWPIDGR